MKNSAQDLDYAATWMLDSEVVPSNYDELEEWIKENEEDLMRILVYGEIDWTGYVEAMHNAQAWISMNRKNFDY